MSKSNYLELNLLKWVTGQTNVLGTAPASGPYLALFTSPPTDAGGGTEVVATNTAYARQEVRGSTIWGVPDGNSPLSNLQAVQFPQAQLAWGTIVAIGLYDSPTRGAGNLLYWTAITSRTVAENDTARFDVGQLTLSED